MPNGNILKSDALVSRTKIYLIIIAVLSIVLCVLNPNVTLIIVMFVLNVALLTYSIWSNRRRKAELSEQLRDLTINVNTTAKTTLINSPFPLAIIETNGNMIWKSEKFVSEFETQEGINNSLNELLNKIKTSIDESDKKERGNINTETIINNKNYQVLGSYVKSHKNNHKNKEQEYTTILYFIDNTEKNKALKTIEDTELCMGIIMIDNYEELTQRLSAEERPIIIANVEKHLYDWAQKYDGVIIKSDRDRFYCIINYKNLKQICSDKMSILDEIKSLETSDASQVTLSIAFSNDGKTNIEKAESVRTVIDIALGRGGDQAIVKLNGKYEFFGGRSQEVEKRTKVKARTFSHALTELMKEADNVILMGHTHSDMDAIGSCLGIYRLAKTLGKEAKIVNDTEGIGIEKFLVEAKKSEEYADAFITREQAKNFVKENSMLVVTDTNRKNYVEMPELLDEVKRIVVIDHHRRSTDYIENATLSFHEVYASSASELVTEVLEYSQVKVKLTNLEMEALYAGIMLDTKEFTFKTGVRTFEAAAYLRKCGVDIIRVKKWFQSDLDTYKTISDIVSKAEIMNDNIAISIYDKENDSNANIIAAKAADELLTIGGITASLLVEEVLVR